MGTCVWSSTRCVLFLGSAPPPRVTECSAPVERPGAGGSRSPAPRDASCYSTLSSTVSIRDAGLTCAPHILRLPGRSQRMAMASQPAGLPVGPVASQLPRQPVSWLNSVARERRGLLALGLSSACPGPFSSPGGEGSDASRVCVLQSSVGCLDLVILVSQRMARYLYLPAHISFSLHGDM